MTLILKLDLDMVKMYAILKMEFLSKGIQSYSPNGHADTHTHTHSLKTLPFHIRGQKQSRVRAPVLRHKLGFFLSV